MDNELAKILRDVIKEELKPINNKLDSLESKVGSLDIQVKENTQILKALEHSAEINKSEHDSMKNDIIHIKGTVEAIKKDLSQVEMVTANNWADIARLKAVK